MNGAALEQAANIERVSARIGEAVHKFCKRLDEAGSRRFYMGGLTDYVSGACAFSIAPDSPGRILRMLRRAKRIDYVVVNRSQSLYEILWARP